MAARATLQPMAREDAPQIEIDSTEALGRWLAAHHADGSGLWLVYPRGGARAGAPGYSQIVRVLLAWGWIDSLPRALDAGRSMLWIAPRRPGSAWSAVNKAHVAALIAAGEMAAAGQAVVDRAVADGSWTALDAVEQGAIPDDLAAALAGQAGAMEAWQGWPRSVQRGALEILLRAKRPATRAAKIATILDAAARGTRPFQWQGRGSGG